ncbi:MAG: FG-GAP repeat domain-containing protein [Patescibacteria group bacterium]
MRKGWRVIFLSLLLTAAPLLAAQADPAVVFRQDEFSFELILAAAAGDLDRDGLAELVVTGRNYLEPEVGVEILRYRERGFASLWRSGNLMESESTVLALPFVLPGGPVLLVLTRTGYRIFRYTQGGYTEESRGAMPLALDKAASGDLMAACGDLDGDGQDEVAIATILRHTKQGSVKALQTLAWRDGRLIAGAASDEVGNIRALAAGDLDRDGRAEIVADVGIAGGPGELAVYALAGEELRRTAVVKNAMPKVAYGLAVGRQFPEPGLAVFAASQPGLMRSFRWAAGGLTPAGKDLSIKGNSPAYLCTGDLDGDGREELALACYKARLLVLAPAAPYLGLELDRKALRPAEPLRRWDDTIYAEAASLAAALGWRCSAAPGGTELRGKTADGGERVLAVGAATLEVTVDGAAAELVPKPRLYLDYLYLPVKPLLELFGYRCAWDAERGVLLVGSKAP